MDAEFGRINKTLDILTDDSKKIQITLGRIDSTQNKRLTPTD